MFVLCDGMIRSGSTWSFNVALNLVRLADPNRKTFGLYNDDPRVLLAAVRPRSSNLVIKSHSLDPALHDPCCSGKVKSIFTWRHPYDAFASAVQMFGRSTDYWMWSMRSALRIWSFHRATASACIIPYESIIKSPLASVARVASYLEIEAGPQALRRIAEITSLKHLREFSHRIGELEDRRLIRKDGCLYDRETLLHQHHIRNGGIGYGRELLSSAQIAAIDALLREEGFEFLCRPAGTRRLHPELLGVASAATY